MTQPNINSAHHKKHSEGKTSCASESGPCIVNFGGEEKASIQASLGYWHTYLACSAGKNGWLVCLQQIYQPPFSEILQQRLLHSLVKTLICRMQRIGCCLLNSQALHDQNSAEKDFFCWYHPSTDKDNLKSIF